MSEEVRQPSLRDIVRLIGLNAIDRGAMALGLPGDVEKLAGVGRPSMNEQVPLGLGQVFGQWGQRVFPDYEQVLRQLAPLEQYLPADTGWRPPNENVHLNPGWTGASIVPDVKPAAPPSPGLKPTNFADWLSLFQQSSPGLFRSQGSPGLLP